MVIVLIGGETFYSYFEQEHQHLHDAILQDSSEDDMTLILAPVSGMKHSLNGLCPFQIFFFLVSITSPLLLLLVSPPLVYMTRHSVV